MASSLLQRFRLLGGIEGKKPEDFAYSDQLARDSIRLLQLLPCKVLNDPLELQILTYPINEPPPYVALSYTWGPPGDEIPAYTIADKIPVLLNERKLLVFPNLFHALKRIRGAWNFKKGPQHIWIDALCINQDDTSERASQVTIMDQIFQRASYTIVWLGESDNHTLQAMRLVKVLSQIPPDPADEAREKALRAIGISPYSDERIYMDMEPWQPWMTLLARRWFSRLWIVQEIVLSKNMVVQVGGVFVEWADLVLAFQVMYTTGLGQLFPDSTGTIDVSKRSVSLENIRQACAGLEIGVEFIEKEVQAWFDCSTITSTSLLMYFCLVHRSCDAQDPRDKVYGLLGIVNDLSRRMAIVPSVIQPAYDEAVSVNAVFQELAERLLKETGSLALLSTVTDSAILRRPYLPSWVPDLSYQNAVDNLCVVIPPFMAYERGDIAECSQTRKFIINGRYLQVRGHEISSIQSNITTAKSFGTFDCSSWIRPLLQLPSAYPFTEESLTEVFWRTLICNRVDGRHPASWPNVPSGDHFRSFIITQIMNHDQRRLFQTSESPNLEAYLATRGDINDLNLLAQKDKTGQIPSIRGWHDCMALFGLTQSVQVHEAEEVLSRIHNRHLEFTKLLSRMSRRAVVVSKDGHLANVPVWAEKGDAIVAVIGSPCPLILRRHAEDKDCWTCLGGAYVYGIMYGEAIKKSTIWKEYKIV
jgi:hypothetical protein